MEHLINVFNGILAALAHESGNDYFKSQEVAFGLAGLTSLCFSYLATLITRSVKQSRFFDWRFKTTGLWIETVSHHVGRQYTISMITYNPKENEFQITGHTYSPGDFDVFSSWRSMAINFPEKDSLYYLYSLRNFRQGPEDVIGIAHMSFFATTGWGERFFDGKGYFLDKTSEAKEVHYSFERITRKVLSDTIGKSSISSPEDRRKFLFKYSRRDARARGKQGKHPPGNESIVHPDQLF